MTQVHQRLYWVRIADLVRQTSHEYELRARDEAEARRYAETYMLDFGIPVGRIAQLEEVTR